MVFICFHEDHGDQLSKISAWIFSEFSRFFLKITEKIAALLHLVPGISSETGVLLSQL